MVTRIIILLALVSASAFGELVVLQRGGEPITTRARCVDVTDYAQWLSWTKHGHPVPVEYPSLVDTDLKLSVVITGNYNQARADLKAMDNARRPAKVELKTFLGGQTPKQFRQSLKAAYRNVETNTAFTVAQRRVLTNVFWAVGAEDDFAELRQAKQAEDTDLEITKEDAQ
jgi:hypothetical protein